ncbi:MAG: C10 family peptidase [bacterium]
MSSRSQSKKTLCLLTVALIAVSVGSITAEVATQSEAALVAQNWATHMAQQDRAWNTAVSPTLGPISQIQSAGLTVGYHVKIEPTGYVVVPILKEMPPVFNFSDESELDLSRTVGAASLIRDLLHERAVQFIDRFGSLEVPQPTGEDRLFETVNRANWDVFAVTAKQFADSRQTAQGRSESVGPLLTSRWHQDSPFNNLCPPGTPVGCVATAAAQIMNYWEWPDEGVGSSGYWWDGDGGPSQYLTAEYWDSHDWANIPDYCPYPDCSTEVHAVNLAELNYEVAVAFEMDFGADGSGVFWSDILAVCMPAMVNNFLYRTGWDSEGRNQGHTAASWFTMIRGEIDAGRPMMYTIEGHAFVCDGWLIDDSEINYYHQNYGWDDSHNAWYVIDNLYYPIGGSYYNDKLIRFIEPDSSVSFTADTRLGWVPFDCYFEGSSDLAVDAWDWDFGDGGSATTDTVTHPYTTPGVYDIALQVTSGAQNHTRTKEKYIIVLADTLYGDSLLVSPTGTSEVTICGTNNLELSELIIPVTLAGDLDVNGPTMAWSTAGCRTAGLDYQQQTNFNPMGKAMTIRLANTGTSSDLPVGTGPVLKVSFELNGPPAFGDSTAVGLGGYGSNDPRFTGSLASYAPIAVDGLIHYSSCCQGIRGNIDGDSQQEINIADLVYLVNYMFNGGPIPPCWKEANVNGDIFEELNIEDLVYLVNYMFNGGPSPAMCF